MWQENVEIVRRLSALLERRDWRGMTDLLDPNVEFTWDCRGAWRKARSLRGISQISQAFETEGDEVWDEHRIEPQEFIDAGDRVVVLQREFQRSKSGVETVIDTAGIVDLRDGRVVRMHGYMNPAEALEAAGLSDG